MSLHIWRLDDNSWWFAETADDALAAMTEETGIGPGDDCCPNDEPPSQWPDDKPLTIVEDDGTGAEETKMPAEWIATHGDVRGFFFAGEP